MNRNLPIEYDAHLQDRGVTRLEGRGLSARAVWTGAFLSFFLASGAPYVNMVMKATFMAFDFSTPGAIFLFLVLIGGLNVLFKLASRSLLPAIILAASALGGYLVWYWPGTGLDAHEPGVQFSTFLLFCALANLPLTVRGQSLALNRSELVLVYVMLLVVSAICTMGMSQQLLPAMAGLLYYATPENNWLDLLPHAQRRLIIDDEGASRVFFEGVGVDGGDIVYHAWVEPLFWWAIFLLALYASMIAISVILRRQWMERERLPYPLTQVALAMVEGEEKTGLINGLFRGYVLWLGCAIPLLAGALRGLSHYDPAFPALDLQTSLPLFGVLNVPIFIRFSIIGFSYFISTQVAAGIWIFYLLSGLERELLQAVSSPWDQMLNYGVEGMPQMAYQGVGALLAMVLAGLWIARGHLQDVALKAIGRAPGVDDSDEIMSYRVAVFVLAGSTVTMTGWLWLMGTPLWVSGLFIIVALLIFVGLTRILAEAGLAALRAPMIAPDLVMAGLGSGLIGATGVFNLSLAYVWCADVRIFFMGMCANGLKLIETMDLRSRRSVVLGMGLALVIGAGGSCWRVLHLAHIHGGINVSNWFFHGGPTVLFNMATRNIEPAGVHWAGLGHLLGGGALMLLMMLARHRLTWWPIHPIGFPISGIFLIKILWANVFIAWAIKCLMLRFGGASAYRRSHRFFLGLIVGETLCNGIWLVIDYFTGAIGNEVFTLQ